MPERHRSVLRPCVPVCVSVVNRVDTADPGKAASTRIFIYILITATRNKRKQQRARGRELFVYSADDNNKKLIVASPEAKLI